MADDAWKITPDMFLASAEVERLLAAIRSALRPGSGAAQDSARLDQLLIEGLLFSGLRNSEFCRLQVRDFRVEQGGSYLEIQSAGVTERKVYVPTHVADLIERYLEKTRPRYLPDDVDRQDAAQPLCYHERRRPFDRTSLYRRVVRILSEVGLGPRASVQLLRHTYGVLAYRRTQGNLLFVQRQLGHAHPMITSVYAQFAEESPARLAESVFVAESPRPL